MATYDLEQTSITINGVPVVGLDPDTGITYQANELWSTSAGTHGAWTRSRAYGEISTVELGLMDESNGNALLSEYLKVDSVTGRGTFNFVHYDGNSGTVIQSSEAFILSEPELAYTSEAGGRTWTIALPNVKKDIKAIPRL